ncbi:MAG: hypothetical protein ACWGNV_07845, partial [Bacteroidales bacterium]
MIKTIFHAFPVPLFLSVFICSCNSSGEKDPIDRFALVNRHRIVVREADTLASLSVGNGNFAITTDIT